MIGEPGEYYFGYNSTRSGKDRIVSEGIKDTNINTNLKDTRTVIGTDGTAAMTEPYNGAIRCSEECLDRSLQWSVCLLYANELPLRHAFLIMDGKTKGPDLFSCLIGNQLYGDQSARNVLEFDQAANPNFPNLAQKTIDLSSDQYYPYKISNAISGIIQDESDLKVGPLRHAR